MRILLCLLLAAWAAFGQAASGTITGTVFDPTGAAVANAPVEVKNSQTGVIYRATTTGTGNYTVPNLPVGSYELSVSYSGFKKYTHTNLAISAAQTLREDVALELGATGEEVTVTAEASLLSTERGDVAHNFTLNQLTNLPILGIGGANAGSSGVRNPYSATQLIPGVKYSANTNMIVNGAPNNTAGYRLEGLDNTNHTVSFALQENQPSADAIQEVAVQTSNYAAEFGQAGGGLFNVTMKSGTNQFHGTAYEYFVNEALNAASPYSNDGSGNKVRPRQRRNNFGGTIGGPVWIPKVYNGHDRTFFFFSYEEFKEASGLNFPDTVPTAAYRQGDFSAISPNGGAAFNTSLGVPSNPVATDALGRPIFANTIYDPLTRGIAPNGSGFANPFPNNIIPLSRFSPFAVSLQKLLPAPTNGNYVGNYAGYNLSERLTKIPSLKLDHSIGTKGKLSFYWSTTGTDSDYSTPNGNADGLPENITGARGTYIHSLTERLNYDHSLTPTLLLHLGAGYSRISFIDDSPFTHNGGKFDCTTINLSGCFVNFNFPTIQNTIGQGSAVVATGSAATLGGLQQLGNAQAHTHTMTLRPAFNANATWVHGNHSIKGGAEVWFQGNIAAPPSGVLLSFNSSTNMGATAQPYSPPSGLQGQQMGFGYANLLLGNAITASQSAPTDTRMGKSQWALFLQDSWKATRKLTLDYGLRWDFATAAREQYGRSASLGLTTPNPAAGGRLGAPVFEATCNCVFVSNYPYAAGPRLGFAYQLNDKTVIRGGWGLAYSFSPDLGANSAAVQNNTAAGINGFLDLQSANALPRPVWPNFDPGQSPLPGQITGFTGFGFVDPHASRPPRQNQYSIGIQREILPNLVIEGSYVGNRGVWWTGPLGYVNQVSPATFAKFGLDPFTKPADNLLLSSSISSAAVVNRVGSVLPYSGFPTTTTLLNALRPYPQFSTIAVTNSPTGNTYYDSLQAKVTKRMSHGLMVNGTFTWSKAMVAISQDIFNPTPSKSIQSSDQPFMLNMNILYETQTWFSNRALALVTKNWQFGVFVQYGSGLPLTPPTATVTNNLGATTMVRVAGQPLYLKDLNCHCINPSTDQVLNPAAWANPAAGGFGPSGTATNTLYYTDFRGARHPVENFNLGRNFRITERINFQIRAEFSNILNRTQLGNPSTVNPLAPVSRQNGVVTGGFGAYTLATVPKGAVPSGTTNSLLPGQLWTLPRQGTIVARFTF
jgi:hypothetical protein